MEHLRSEEDIIETCEVTILFSDLHGFTAMSENYPAKFIIESLNRYFSTMSEIIVTQHGGTIDKFMGDAIMAIFGIPESRTDDVERALSCAIHMQIAMSAINQQNESFGMPHFYMGIGINSGNVVLGKVGSMLHSEYTVIGNEVNLASRIETYSLRGQVLISENTYQRAKDYIETSNATQVSVKGKIHPVNIYELLATKRPTLLTVPRREVRKSPRIDVDMPFTYQRVVEKYVLPEEYGGQIMNISYDGLLINITEPLEVFSEIKFALAFPVAGNQTSDIYAKILRVQEREDYYLASIEFTSIHIHAKTAIKMFINRIIQGL